MMTKFNASLVQNEPLWILRHPKFTSYGVTEESEPRVYSLKVGKFLKLTQKDEHEPLSFNLRDAKGNTHRVEVDHFATQCLNAEM